MYIISKLVIKYLLLLGQYNLACFLIGDVFHNMLICSLEMHRSDAPYRKLWRVDPLDGGHNTVEGLAQPSQKGLEIKVSLRMVLVGAPGSVAWFYVNGECGGYGIECSGIERKKMKEQVETPFTF
ncbi:hypothetical protein M9H77_23290 [Catharanthus roseus]|uniref:Uncharacterized protein n=1 Tax=Catharanthus roseus TaxID=4058 RepID=A0ACC0AU42_CATRO|nr:hypothetical protein M9H77_23290 [Catharanthus roseus]